MKLVFYLQIKSGIYTENGGIQMINLPRNNYEVCGTKLYNKEARCNVVASHWTGIGTLLCIRADSVC